MLRQYAAAMLPDTRRVLGRVMEPMSLGHTLLLARLNSPFVVKQETIPLLGDLRLGMLVCSRPYDRAVKAVSGRFAWVRLYAMRVGMKHIVEGMKQFAAYVQASRSMPDSFDAERTPGGWQLRTPFLLQVKIALQTDFKMSEREALNAPLGKALWEFMALAEMKGQKRLVGDQDAEAKRDAEQSLEVFGDQLKAWRERMASMTGEDLKAYDPRTERN